VETQREGREDPQGHQRSSPPLAARGGNGLWGERQKERWFSWCKVHIVYQLHPLVQCYTAVHTHTNMSVYVHYTTHAVYTCTCIHLVV
jgi:hypothetical protein